MDLGSACALRRHPSDRGLCPKPDVHAAYGGTGHQDVGSYIRNEHCSLTRWADHKLHCSQIMKVRARHERLDNGGVVVPECAMTGRRIQNRWTTPNVVLTLAVIGGLILCYFLAIPFLPAIVWSVTFGVLFVPLDARLRSWTRSANISAAATVAIVAFIVVVPGILVVGSLLNEATRSVAVISPMLDADRWTHLLDNHPRLAPTLRWINERLDLPDLIKASISLMAGWSGSIVRASFSGALNLLLTFYFFFYILRDREKAIALAQETLPLSDSEFSTISDRFTNTIFATVAGTAAVSALQGALGGGMFWWLGLPAPVFWGVLMALVAVVPFLGAGRRRRCSLRFRESLLPPSFSRSGAPSWSAWSTTWSTRSWSARSS